MLKRILISSIFALIACKPDVDVKMSTADILEVASTSQSTMIKFDARIENKYVEIDNKKRAEIEAIVDVIKAYFHKAEVDVYYGGSGYKIEIEGELEMTKNPPNSKNPWYFQVLSTDNQLHEIRQKKTSTWESFAAELNKITYYSKPDDFLPINIKLKNNGGEIVVGGAVLNGERLSGFEKIFLNGNTIGLSFDGDHWEKAPAAFLFVEP